MDSALHVQVTLMRSGRFLAQSPIHTIRRQQPRHRIYSQGQRKRDENKFSVSHMPKRVGDGRPKPQTKPQNKQGRKTNGPSIKPDTPNNGA